MTRSGRIALVAAAIVLILTVFGLVTASAQGPALQIGQAALQIWPEYDDPGVLVIFSGALTGTTSFPQTIALPIPTGARDIQATFEDASGSLMNREYEIKDGKLTYELPTANFHVEYYVDRQPGGSQRDVRYTFEAPYAIQTLFVSVQQPARATEFTLSPAAQNVEAKSDALTYHSFARQNLAAGEKLEIAARYTKTDNGLSAPQLSVPGEAPAASSPQSGGAGNNVLPWVLIGVGVTALAGIAAYYFLSQRRAAPEPRTAPGKGVTPPAVRPPPLRPATGAPGGVFCTQCGKPLRTGDRFCAQCGAARRS